MCWEGKKRLRTDGDVLAADGETHRLSFQTELHASPTKVWALIGAFDSLPQWHPLVADCTLERDPAGATVRRIRLHDGTVIRNRLLDNDEAGHRYSYEFVEGPLTVKRYRATLCIAPAGDGRARLTWISEFETDPGTVEDVRRRVESLISPGIANLERLFGT